MGAVITDKKRIEEIFERGTVVEVFPSKKELMERLLSGNKIRIYYGLDPTHTAIHLGHAKNLIFLEEIRQLGHEVIVLFGNFTARVGDPSDKGAARKQLSVGEVERNMRDWQKQIEKIMFKGAGGPVNWRRNADWLSKLTMEQVIDLSSNFTVQQMLERDMFQKRIKDNAPIYLHEFLYPLLQGQDSVEMDVDAELCGTDQIFNALVGRTLLKKKGKDKFVIALNLLANPATGELMSKSNGTGVFIDQSARQLFGSIMALPDAMIEPLFINCTRIPLSEKEAIMNEGPRKSKARIARDIVKRLHGEGEAAEAEEEFEKTFTKGGLPDKIEEFILPNDINLADRLVKKEFVPSKAEWRRLVEAGAVRDEDDEKITDPNFRPTKTMILKIGKRRFVKVVIQ